MDDDGNGLFFEPVNRKNSEAIYFIAAMSEVGAREIKLERLTTFNDFTDTVPDYRANLEVLNDKAGFSSYQAEYPFKMTERSGAIVSSLATLTNKNADQNLLFFRNIFHVPEHKTGRGYIISKTRRQVLRHIELVTNSTTCVTLRADEMGPTVTLSARTCLEFRSMFPHRRTAQSAWSTRIHHIQTCWGRGNLN